MMKKIRHKIRFIIYTLIISFLLSLLFQSKYTNSFELNSTDSFVNLFMSPIRPQPPPLLPSSPSFSLSTSLPLISSNYNFSFMLFILLIITFTSTCLTLIIRKFIYKNKRILNIFKQEKLKDVEFGSYSFEEWEFERQQILNEKRKKRISYMIHSQLPTIYEEHDVLVV
ncbi:unnamed protein product [Rhizophagus irregularis]|nr:unnamed protein product [Rhizophagus irregularis]CAB5348143.1 unnamed protein product [Rhizophagus irregularis]